MKNIVHHAHGKENVSTERSTHVYRCRCRFEENGWGSLGGEGVIPGYRMKSKQNFRSTYSYNVFPVSEYREIIPTNEGALYI